MTNSTGANSVPFVMLFVILRPLGVENPSLVHALVGMRPKVVALHLDQVSRQVSGPQAVYICQGSHEGRRRQAQTRHGLDHAMQVRQAYGYCLTQRWVQQQVQQVRLPQVSRADRLEQLRANDAATTPDARHSR